MAFIIGTTVEFNRRNWKEDSRRKIILRVRQLSPPPRRGSRMRIASDPTWSWLAAIIWKASNCRSVMLTMLMMNAIRVSFFWIWIIASSIRSVVRQVLNWRIILSVVFCKNQTHLSAIALTIKHPKDSFAVLQTMMMWWPEVKELSIRSSHHSCSLQSLCHSHVSANYTLRCKRLHPLLFLQCHVKPRSIVILLCEQIPELIWANHYENYLIAM